MLIVAEKTMEQKASNTDDPSTFFSPEEIEVSEILLQLRYTVSHSCCSRNVFGPSWGRTKRRSVPPPEFINGNATSPAALVLCSPRETHGKSESLKRRRENSVEMINDFTERRELLNTKTGKVEAHKEKPKATNYELKSRKQEHSCTVHQPMMIVDLIADANVGALGLPRVDFSLEHKRVEMECTRGFDLDFHEKILRKAMSAEARRVRMKIYRVKNSIAASRHRNPLGLNR